ncbi:hypothetical protein LZ012_10330 [Dechloromonas sp. XY25]|uniref:Uncharacterized protein n=1 Tax=Dechloromonas hankyongensis TaxID=2908002 RepID=A0ABS9K2U0_9RHOO|nr:hypothetical protein [Dechloromonas hankyongensis]MCG2577389.1 hypothetical protein [Dechloromonas hankyongensis]
MEKASFDRRQQPRHQTQQQPQQNAQSGSATGKPESPRLTWQNLSNAQARKQSGKL